MILTAGLFANDGRSLLARFDIPASAIPATRRAQSGDGYLLLVAGCRTLIQRLITSRSVCVGFGGLVARRMGYRAVVYAGRKRSMILTAGLFANDGRSLLARFD